MYQLRIVFVRVAYGRFCLMLWLIWYWSIREEDGVSLISNTEHRQTANKMVQLNLISNLKQRQKHLSHASKI